MMLAQITLPFSDLGCASFDSKLVIQAHAMPGNSIPAHLQQETRLSLKVLSTFHNEPLDSNRVLAHIEAKLDLALELMLRTQHPEHSQLSSCRVGLTHLAWMSRQACQTGNLLLLSLYPIAGSALTLWLPVTVLTVNSLDQADNTPCMILGELHNMFGELNQQLWEQWVFYHHRLAIAIPINTPTDLWPHPK